MNNLPIEHLSFSSLRTFLANPWQFRKEWILGLRDRKMSPSMLVGKALHLYAERYYSGKDPMEARKEALEMVSSVGSAEVDWGKTGSIEKSLKDLNKTIDFFDLYCSGLTGVLSTEVSVTTNFSIKGSTAPLPLKAITDLVRKDEDGNLILIDWKTVSAFANPDEEVPLLIMQAIFNFYTINAKYGKAPVRMDYYQIKKSLPRNGSKPVQIYTVDFSHQEYFMFFSRIYTGFIKLISDDDYCYLPNLSDLLTAEDSWKDFTSEVLDFSQPKRVSHRSLSDVMVNTQGAKRIMQAQVEKEDKELIADKLLEFGVVSELKQERDCQFGTRYTYAISRGVPVSKLKKLKEDIEFALNTAIELSLTGKQELTVTALSDNRPATIAPTPIAGKLLIGTSIDDEVVSIELKKDPHVLIAGTTGSGKSYLLTGLIRQARKFTKVKVIDIKGEISSRAIRSDASAVKMLRKVLADIREKQATPLIIFIDELGDLILSKTPIRDGCKGKKDIFRPIGSVIETLLVRICQLGRSQGVHVVAATQRPSIQVCTGILKANMPARVGLRTATSIDSKVIIDDVGCEQLIGYGDAYVVRAGKKIRTQCFTQKG